MRRRILLLVVGMTTLVVLAFAVPLMFLTRQVIGSNADSAIAQQATSIANILRTTNPTRAEIRNLVAHLISESGHAISVRLPDGSTVGITPADSDGPTPTFAPSHGDGEPGGHPDGDHDAPPQVKPSHGGEIAVAVAGSPNGPYVVRVYLSDSQHYEGLSGWYALIIGASLSLIVLG